MIVFLIQVVCYRMIVEYAATVSGGTRMSDEYLLSILEEKDQTLKKNLEY